MKFLYIYIYSSSVSVYATELFFKGWTNFHKIFGAFLSGSLDGLGWKYTGVILNHHKFTMCSLKIHLNQLSTTYECRAVKITCDIGKISLAH